MAKRRKVAKRRIRKVLRKPLTKRAKSSMYMVGGNYGKQPVKYRLTAKKVRVKKTKSGYLIEGFSDLKIQ